MTLSRITKKFNSLKREGKKAFIPYIMAGDPSLEATKELVLLLEDCGADIPPASRDRRCPGRAAQLCGEEEACFQREIKLKQEMVIWEQY